MLPWPSNSNLVFVSFQGNCLEFKALVIHVMMIV